MKEMKRIALIVLSLIMVLGSFTAMPMASAEGIPALLGEGYTFTDIAHKTNADGSTTYVAMAKNEAADKALLLYSNDGGITWVRSTNQPLAENSALISSNKISQQQLIYWKEKGVFVAHGASKTFTSTDGNTWTECANIHWTTNTMLAPEGDSIVFAGADSVNITNSMSTKLFAANKFSLNTSNKFMQIVGVKKRGVDGKLRVFAADKWNAFDVDMDTAAPKEQSTIAAKRSGTVFVKDPYDAAYMEKADVILAVDGTEKLTVITDSNNMSGVMVAEGETVTGVGVSDKYAVVGTASGKLFRTEHTESGITPETFWTEIPARGTQPAGAVKNIEFADDGESFIALGTNQIYKGTKLDFANVDEYSMIGTPYITAENEPVFDGVRLIGGTYGNVNGEDVYLVYGDTVAPGEQGKRWGKIFISNDGKNWEQVYQSYTFSRQNLNDDGSVRSYTEIRNGAVWWEAQKMFVVSASTKDHSGVLLTSADGRKWNELQTAVTDFKLNTDIAVGGDKLYTTNNGRQFRTYTALNKENMVYTGVTNVSDTWYMNQIAVSNDSENPAVFMIQNANGAVRNNKSNAAEELDNWKGIGNATGGANATDLVYSSALERFVVVSDGGRLVSLVSPDGTVSQGPKPKDNSAFHAVATDGRSFMFAGVNGKLCTAPDTADFAASAYTEVPSTGEVNTMPLTNVFAGETDTFVATASDGKNSAVLLVKKNGAEWSYTSTADAGKVTELQPGQVLNVNVDGVNKSGTDYNFDLVAVIYANGVLVQAETAPQTIGAGASQTVTMPVQVVDNLPAGAEIRVYLWDSVESMKPLAEVTVNPF